MSSLSCVQLFAAPWTVAHQAPLSMGILQARILEWVAILFSRGSSQPRDRTQVSLFTGSFFTAQAIREAAVTNKSYSLSPRKRTRPNCQNLIQHSRRQYSDDKTINNERNRILLFELYFFHKDLESFNTIQLVNYVSLSNVKVFFFLFSG